MIIRGLVLTSGWSVTTIYNYLFSVTTIYLAPGSCNTSNSIPLTTGEGPMTPLIPVLSRATVLMASWLCFQFLIWQGWRRRDRALNDQGPPINVDE